MGDMFGAIPTPKPGHWIGAIWVPDADPAGATDAEVASAVAVENAARSAADASEIATRAANDATEAASRISGLAGKENVTLVGTLANRPAAAAGNNNTFYFATDDNGGTLYFSNGSAWTKAAASVTQSGGAELGYAEITANATSVTTIPTYTDVAGLAITVTVGVRPIEIVFDCANVSNASTGAGAIAIMEGSNILAGAFHNLGAGVGVPLRRKIRLAPSAGSHTYKIGLGRFAAAGTTSLFAQATNPASIQAVEL